jgi:hypothetical protein
VVNRKYLQALSIAVCLSIAATSNVDAHNVNLASFKFMPSATDPRDNPLVLDQTSWTLTVNTSLHNLHQSLLKTNKEEQLIDGGVYNRHIAIEYLMNNTHITLNDEISSVELQHIRSSIGNHQSIFVFKILNSPANITSFNFDIPAMSDNPNQMNLIKVTGGEWNTHIVLSKKNNFQGELTLKP